ncbi:MAG: hypothetical protein D3910_25030 [Candidatus Electrothrix sp. ATG2]|nr:hypothetical protein [Candidatus Electrothrix sp. ATG2]
MKPGKGQVQENRRNARAVRTPNLGGHVRRTIQYRVGKCIMLPDGEKLSTHPSGVGQQIMVDKLQAVYKTDWRDSRTKN